MYLGGEINLTKSTALFEFLHSISRKKPAYLVINSAGGSEAHGFAMHDLIKLYASDKLVAVVVGECQSSALLPFLACKTRYATPNASFMIHHGTTKQPDPLHTREFLEFTKEVRRTDDKYARIIADETGMALKAVKKMLRFGSFFGSDQALKFGFIKGVKEKWKP